MQSNKAVARIVKPSAHNEAAERVIANKRKGDKRNKPKRGTGYKGAFLNANDGSFDTNHMYA